MSKAQQQVGPASEFERSRRQVLGEVLARTARRYPDKLAQDELPMPVRIIGLADSFDAMTSARPYRAPLSVGSALSDLVRMAPEKYDPNVVQALLIQVRRDVVGSSRTPLLDTMSVNIAATDIDHLAATLQHKVSRGKMYLT